MSIIKTQKIAFSLALKNLIKNKKQTFLSLVGVVIGVMLIIIVLALGAGVKNYVLNEIESFGSNIINVEVKIPGTEKNSSDNAGGIASGTEIKTLKIDDAKDLSELENLTDWYAGIISQEIASYENENKSSMIMGVTSGIFNIDKNLKIGEGISFNPRNDEKSENIVILGSEIKKNLFGNKNAVGKKIKIGNQRYTVTGVLKERGGGGFFDFDSILYIPIKTVQNNILNSDHVQWIVFKSTNPEKDPSTVRLMEKILRKNHDIKKEIDDDFAVTSIAEATKIIDKVFNILNYLLIALTSISLVVGGVGIMNVMYIAVTERTFEIGLRKSIGAKKRDILMQFVFEAILLTSIGGIMGILSGFSVLKIVEYIAPKFGYNLSFPITLFSVFLATGFSVLIGIFFGYKPAKKASEMTPNEALRNE